MADKTFDDLRPTEEIEGAAPAETTAELRDRHISESIVLNRYLYRKAQQVELMMLDCNDLQELIEMLLLRVPRYVGFSTMELWLYDPDQVLVGLLAEPSVFGTSLQFHTDLFVMQELYNLEPEVQHVDATDTRMFDVLKSADELEAALLLPLLDSGRLIGSLHCGITELPFAIEDAELRRLGHLAAMASLSMKNAVSRQQVARLAMIDPLTEIANLQGFEKDIAREVARAHRGDKAVSVLMLEIDEYDELYKHYGVVTGRFLVKTIAERVASGLRVTDYLARLTGARLALLVPECGEMVAGEIAERLRRDIENFSVDDGRGASLQVTLSIGHSTWQPQGFPAINMVQLASQLETAASKALASARKEGGNQVRSNRLTTLMV